MAPLNFSLPRDDYVAPVFQNTPPIVNIHTAAPRFGHTNDFSALVLPDTTSAERQDYAIGLFVSSIMVLLLLVIWGIVLIVLKCMGRRVGCASGRRFTYPPNRPDSMMEKSECSLPEQEQALPSSATAQRPLDSQQSTNRPKVAPEMASDEADRGATSSDGGKCVGSDSPSMDISESKSGEEESARDENALSGIPADEAIHTSVALEVDKGDQDQECKQAEKLYQRLDDMNWQIEAQKVDRAARRTRTAFLLSGVVVIIFSILFICFGVQNMANSVYSIQGSLLQTSGVIEYSINVTNAIIVTLDDAQDLRNGINETLVVINSCLNGTEDSLVALVDAFADLAFALDSLGSSLVEEATSIQDDLYTTLELVGKVGEATEYSYWAFFTASALTVAFVILIVWLMIGVVLAAAKREARVLSCTRTYLCLPLFILMVVLIWIFASVFLLMAITSSDYCFDSPNNNTVDLMENFQDDFNSIVYTLILYYITGCDDQYSPTAKFSDQFRTLADVIRITHQFLVELALTSSVALSSCGVDKSLVASTANKLDDTLHTIIELLLRSMATFRCANFNPIYVGIAYNAICYDGVTGLNWMFWSLFVVCIFGMIMITLRVSWVEIRDGDEQGNGILRGGGSNQCSTCCSSSCPTARTWGCLKKNRGRGENAAAAGAGEGDPKGDESDDS